MKSKLTLILASLAICGICHAGPSVAPPPKVNSVNVRGADFSLVKNVSDPKDLKLLQDMFLRAKRVGDTATMLKTPTHKIDFSNRWLIDINSGEIGVLSKGVTDVYQLDAKDLIALKGLLGKI